MSDDNQKPLNETYDELKQLRDQVKLKVHLGGMEVRDHWEELEDQWDTWTDQVGKELEASTEDLEKKIRESGGEDLRKIEIRTKLAVQSLKKGFQELAGKLAEK